MNKLSNNEDLNISELIDNKEIVQQASNYNVITGGDNNYLIYRLNQSIRKAKQIDIIVSFLMESGVNAIINGSTTNNEQELYRVRKSWSDAKSQLGAYKILANAKKSCPVGYNVYNKAGEVIYSNTTQNKKTNEQIAREVICGKWGNGTERKNRLESAGYNYYEVQKIVNKLMK